MLLSRVTLSKLKLQVMAQDLFKEKMGWLEGTKLKIQPRQSGNSFTTHTSCKETQSKVNNYRAMEEEDKLFARKPQA